MATIRCLTSGRATCWSRSSPPRCRAGDIKYRSGEVHEFYGKATGHHGGIHGRRAFPMPMQLGRDVAGEVAAVGESVTTLAPGDGVLGMTNPENTLSLASIRGLGNLSGGIDLPGHTMFGGYAQFVA